MIHIDAASCVSMGVEGSFTSCPVAQAAQPWVADVLTAYRHAEGGRLLAFDPAPSAALMDGIDIVDRAVKALESQRMKPKGEGGDRG